MTRQRAPARLRPWRPRLRQSRLRRSRRQSRPRRPRRRSRNPPSWHRPLRSHIRLPSQSPRLHQNLLLRRLPPHPHRRSSKNHQPKPQRSSKRLRPNCHWQLLVSRRRHHRRRRVDSFPRHCAFASRIRTRHHRRRDLWRPRNDRRSHSRAWCNRPRRRRPLRRVLQRPARRLDLGHRDRLLRDDQVIRHRRVRRRAACLVVRARFRRSRFVRSSHSRRVLACRASPVSVRHLDSSGHRSRSIDPASVRRRHGANVHPHRRCRWRRPRRLRSHGRSRSPRA